ncbi:Voltage-gated Ion Channel (VIC) Superfamily [Phytophthora cinnamomi]|uniref:Voltage-gated Ion Channel (VIC) Superfamily n=1 Tax=Phytophthora cinnamomi TaxID=4785 RepID=UPI0035598613|nr:Voltage-gated Ion Channel (VIC) Superfamily [Phytophthora cinnamomi]
MSGPRQCGGHPATQALLSMQTQTLVDYFERRVALRKRIAERQKKEADRLGCREHEAASHARGTAERREDLEAAIDQHQRDARRRSYIQWKWHRGAPSQAMTDELVFALLNESLESQIAEIDTVFELSGIAHVNRDMNNGTKVHQDPNGVSTRPEMMLGPFKTEVVGDNRMNVTMIEKIQ